MPDAGKPEVRFDEREVETEHGPIHPSPDRYGGFIRWLIVVGLLLLIVQLLYRALAGLPAA